MKKIYSAIVFATLGISTIANAQNPVAKAEEQGYRHKYSGIEDELYFPNEINHDDYGLNSDIGATKHISAPVNGVYWIKLEAFAKGEATKKSQPSDFVLVLDVSGSMNYSLGTAEYESAGNSWSTSIINNASEWYWYRQNNGAYKNVVVYNNRLAYAGDDGYYHYISNGSSWTGTLYRIKNTRIKALKDAVNSFIEQVNTNDTQDMGGNPRDNRLGNRIAIVTFSTDAEVHKVNGNSLVSLGTSISDRSGANNLIDIVNGLEATGGTYAHRGMNEAYSIINGLDNNRKLRTVVLFTDGVPGLWGEWQDNSWGYSNNIDPAWRVESMDGYRARKNADTRNTADATINNANNIKLKTTQDIVSNVFTVSIIEGPSSETITYLDKTSSNYIEATDMSNGKINPDAKTDYSLSAKSAEELKAAFDAIAGITGDAYDTDLSSSSTTVDVISSSFTLGKKGSTISTDLIQIYTAPYLYAKEGDSYKLYFGPETIAPDSEDMYDRYKYIKNADGSVTKQHQGRFQVDDDIEINSEKLKDNIIEVTGFDYTNNWCGPIKEDGKVAGAQGHKVIILIPIRMDDDAVGGPKVLTNAEGSGIFRTGAAGEEPIIAFKSPAVSLPVNLSIKKDQIVNSNHENLKQGENAKFTIMRAVIHKPDGAPADWHPTYSELTGWEYVTSIFVPNKAEKNEVRINGLPSTCNEGEYVYRIIEEDWSWTYKFDSATGKGYVKNDSGEIEIKDIEIKNKFSVYSDQFVTNPITFTNKEEANSDTRVRHAESKVTNTFVPKATGSTEGKVTTYDSKSND